MTLARGAWFGNFVVRTAGLGHVVYTRPSVHVDRKPGVARGLDHLAHRLVTRVLLPGVEVEASETNRITIVSIRALELNHPLVLPSVSRLLELDNRIGVDLIAKKNLPNRRGIVEKAHEESVVVRSVEVVFICVSLAKALNREGVRDLKIATKLLGPSFDTSDARELRARGVLSDVVECLLIVGANELVHVKVIHHVLRTDFPVTRAFRVVEVGKSRRREDSEHEETAHR
mmetsp:Transcript_57892/g.159801  ORF Transcript_57892/g.159801 Transcript_57892/m.159801 type:complete len:230 (+) Transcript_57892:224-913(+)